MPSMGHEAPLEVLRHDPSLIPTLLRDALGVAVPPFAHADVAEAAFTQVVPAEFRADLVLVLRGHADRAPVMAIVVEIQLRRDEAKRRTWPLYVAALHARMSCPTCLAVIAGDEGTAAWAAKPIDTLQPGVPFAPLVIGPSQVPRVTGERARAHPWLAVLSSLTHGNGSRGTDIALAAIDALAELPDHHARLGYDLILASLEPGARRILEAAMEPGKYEYKSDFARKYFGEGKAEGKAEGRLLATRDVLRSIAVRRLGRIDPMTGARIDGCGDVELMNRLILDLASAPDAAAVERLLEEALR